MRRKLAHFFCVFLVLLCSAECLALEEAQPFSQGASSAAYYGFTI